MGPEGDLRQQRPRAERHARLGGEPVLERYRIEAVGVDDVGGLAAEEVPHGLSIGVPEFVGVYGYDPGGPLAPGDARQDGHEVALVKAGQSELRDGDTGVGGGQLGEQRPRPVGGGMVDQEQPVEALCPKMVDAEPHDVILVPHCPDRPDRPVARRSAMHRQVGGEREVPRYIPATPRAVVAVEVLLDEYPQRHAEAGQPSHHDATGTERAHSSTSGTTSAIRVGR
jgi:hypothetical protein